MTVRVVLADDHALFRQGLKSLLELRDDVDLVGEVERVDELAPLLDRVDCDVLLLDLQMDRWSGEEIESLSQRVRVLVLTASERSEDALAAVRHGARGVVHKRFAVETLIDAIRAVAEDNVWLPPALQADVTREWTSESGLLTAREREIVALVGQGLRNSEIAARLFISELTVKTHLNNVFQKLPVRDRVELALFAVRAGLADLRGTAR
ncbi:MAG: LuxR C-terminal-related transcriptional regulator [Candidatus Binatia bacterium]